jgi:hypothetical protein
VELLELVLTLPGVTVPSGLLVGGVVSFVSAFVVVVRSLVAVGAGAVPLGATTVVGGALCSQPTSIKPKIVAAKAEMYFLLKRIVVIPFPSF